MKHMVTLDLYIWEYHYCIILPLLYWMKRLIWKCFTWRRCSVWCINEWADNTVLLIYVYATFMYVLLCQQAASTSHHRQMAASVDRKQLSREIQELRVELSQKNLRLESIEADCQRKVAELEQKLGETLSQRQLLQVSWVCVYLHVLRVCLFISGLKLALKIRSPICFSTF